MINFWVTCIATVLSVVGLVITMTGFRRPYQNARTVVTTPTMTVYVTTKFAEGATVKAYTLAQHIDSVLSNFEGQRDHQGVRPPVNASLQVRHFGSKAPTSGQRYNDRLNRESLAA
ncbi:MAG: hypothetical protein OSB38_13900 [Paraburkholderia fungorum]|nr:hypothetical protein [Paraburkholderia fungorum]